MDCRRDALGALDFRRSSDRLKNRLATFSGKVYPFSFISTEGPTNQKPKHRQDREGCRHPFAVPVCPVYLADRLPEYAVGKLEQVAAPNGDSEQPIRADQTP